MSDQLEVMVGRIDERLNGFCERLDAIAERLDVTFVTKDEFRPVQKVAYGLVAAVLLAVVGAAMALVLH